MAIRVGAADPYWAERQRDQQRRSMLGLLQAMQAYDEKRQAKVESELDAGFGTPGWFGSDMSRAWLEKAKKYPDLLAKYQEGESRSRAWSGLFNDYRESFLGGDPRALLQAFAEQPPENMHGFLEGAKDLGIPSDFLVQEPLQFSHVPEPYAPLLAFGMEGKVPQEDLVSSARVFGQLDASPRALAEEEAKQAGRLELEGVRQANKVALKGASGGAAGATKKPTAAEAKARVEALESQFLAAVGYNEPEETSAPAGRAAARQPASSATTKARLQMDRHKVFAKSAAAKLAEIQDLLQQASPEVQEELADAAGVDFWSSIYLEPPKLPEGASEDFGPPTNAAKHYRGQQNAILQRMERVLHYLRTGRFSTR